MVRANDYWIGNGSDMTSHGRQRGIALFMGLIFLVLLSLAAIVSMRGTLLEMRMATATARHEQAFEASEALRVIPEAVLAPHVYNRGWPESWGGNVPDEAFDLSGIFASRGAWISLLRPSSSGGLQKACGGLPNFYEASACENGGIPTSAYYLPSAWKPTFLLRTCTGVSPAACRADQIIHASISIMRDGEVIDAGNGNAQAEGYAGKGVGAADGGGAMLFEIRSDATVPGDGEAVTIAQYKVEIADPDLTESDSKTE